MKIRYCIVFLVFFAVSVSLFGVEIDSIKIELNNRCFSKLDSFLVHSKSSNKYFNSYQVRNRQIVSSFQEIIIEFDESFPLESENNRFVKSYKLFLLVSNDRIVYCKLKNTSIDAYHPVILEYQEHDSLHVLKKKYISTYKRRVGIHRFFREKIVYGKRCGDVGTKTKYGLKLEKLVQGKRLRKLRRWLSSPIVELQVFAVDGFYQLHQNGYVLTARERELIELVKSKEGEIQYCTGCIYTSFSIQGICSRFKFID